MYARDCVRGRNAKQLYQKGRAGRKQLLFDRSTFAEAQLCYRRFVRVRVYLCALSLFSSHNTTPGRSVSPSRAEQCAISTKVVKFARAIGVIETHGSFLQKRCRKDASSTKQLKKLPCTRRVGCIQVPRKEVFLINSCARV